MTNNVQDQDRDRTRYSIAVQWLYAYDVAYTYSDDTPPVPGQAMSEQYYRVYGCVDPIGPRKVAGLLGGGFHIVRVVNGDIVIPSNVIG